MDRAHKGRAPVRGFAGRGPRLHPPTRGGQRRAGGDHLNRVRSRRHHRPRRIRRGLLVRRVDAGPGLTPVGCGLLVAALGVVVAQHHSPSMTVTADEVRTGAVALRCAGLVKRYADVVAVNGLDLEVRTGECFGLLGPNGAGKTTTIEILEGLTRHDAGEVEILGTSWERDGDALRERLGISLQETQLTEKLTVGETIRLFRSFYRNGRDPEEVLRQLSLDEKRNARVGKLSGGQKQRLAVACALV